MELNNSETSNWLTLAEANRGLSSTKSGDYSNSAELNQGLAHASNTVSEHNAVGMAPEIGNMVAPNTVSGQVPANVPSGMPTSLPGGLPIAPGELPKSIPGGNYLTAAPSQMPSTDLAGGYLNPAMKMMSNPSVASQPTQGSGSMPKQEVLMEPCTINQPINSSLRENFSTGNFYFLPKA